MPESWYPNAIRNQVGTPGSYAGGPSKCVLHTTENDPNFTTAMDVVKWMEVNKPGSVYHLIYHPITGECVQMLPVNGSAKSLSNPSGGVETNRGGSVVIQISVVAKAADPFTRYDLPYWSSLLNWISSWGVPAVWAGPPPIGKVDHVSNSYWNQNSGWYGHCCVPENNHHDPGKVNLDKLGLVIHQEGTGNGGTSSGSYSLEYTDGAHMSLRYLSRGSEGYDVGTLQMLLSYTGDEIAVDGIFGPETEEAVEFFQGNEGLESDGIVGPKTMSKLLEG